MPLRGKLSEFTRADKTMCGIAGYLGGFSPGLLPGRKSDRRPDRTNQAGRDTSVESQA